ncbi:MULTISPECIES: response regulator [Gammaproteobacteria]|uniref:response regulator n=1 Tax=Gammaproteobacteria TaxID=1236 RepID=UPI001403B115|nr:MULTISPECIES: response regulator [Gammaproteobacteria]
MSKQILLVEDNAKTREQLSLFLAQAGYQFITAVDGLDGLNKALNQEFSLIITDHKMPLMDGFALARNLRDNATYEDTPIVLLTTDDFQNVEQKALKLGVNLVLPKPVSFEELGNVLDEYEERDIA